MNRRRKRDFKEPLTAIDAFSGCGGLSVGLGRAGFRVVAAVEVEPTARAVYAINHPNVPLLRDIKRVGGKRLLHSIGLRVGQLDLLAGCPPCQGFSRLRTKNKGRSVGDPRNDLISEFQRLIRSMRPRMVMLENVPSLKGDYRLRCLRDSLESAGYKVVVEVLNAGDYAVPQRRKRLILLASRIHQPQIAPKSPKKVTVRDALRGVIHPSRSRDALHRIPERRSATVREIIRLVPKDGGSRRDLPRKYQLDCHRRCDGFGDTYGRMAWDALSPTITSGCVNPSKGRFIHPSDNRTITLREAAILQGFPRSYKFDVSIGKEAIALMIGNALPPPFIAAHARSLRRGMLLAVSSKAGG